MILSTALSRLATLRVCAIDLHRSLGEAHLAAPGIRFHFDDQGRLHAHLGVGMDCPGEVERRCDYITRKLADGRVEFLKFRDDPTPPPYTPSADVELCGACGGTGSLPSER